ncbi:DEAD/DEAH box helicase family protein [Nocardioides sp. MAHUQ-72]|uniref:DEAD/DEAH box helicase family protein n=1 Tax=unclassified Nocardioides TaxID=2615069 RepID=UPI00361CB665
MTSTTTIARAFTGTTCRDRLRQVLAAIDDLGGVGPEVLPRLVEDSACTAGHDLHYASLTSGLIREDAAGMLRLSRSGDDWLLDNGRPSPSWRRSIAGGAPPLRDWQDEALRAWCAHARHGVIEAVTGTGKSRVGVEATREALADDYTVVVVVPTVDLVAQWVQTLRQNNVPGVGAVGDGSKASFRTHRVLVGTVQSLYPAPPTRPDGKVLVVADECHRYGAGQWRRVLHPSYRRRLGLTATFERNDDGIKDLLSYFGGGPVFTIGFQRAIADGVVAPYDVKLLGVQLTHQERAEYDEADRTLRDTRLQLLAADFPPDPFGAFLHEVQRAAEDDADPTITEVARRYLKAFSRRIDVTTNAAAKLDVARRLAPVVKRSAGCIVFTRRVDMAEEIAAALVESDVRAEPIHSELTRTQRDERLAALRGGRIKALVAPTILDEGIDVPDIDLAVVMGGSRSRRQMIQRMGRVLRLKADRRKATFIVVYAENTAEDLTLTDGAEGCLDLIVESAGSVVRMDGRDDLRVSALDPPERDASGAPALHVASSPAHVSTHAESTKKPATVEDGQRAILDIDPMTLPMTRRTLRGFTHAHGSEDHEAEIALRRMLADFLEFATMTAWPHQLGAFALCHQGLEVVVTPHHFVQYLSRRNDASTWDDLRDTALPRPVAHPGSEDRTKTADTRVTQRSHRSELPTRRTRPQDGQRSRPTTSPMGSAEMLRQHPTMLLDLLDARSIAVDLPVVTRACAAFGLGDPFTEEALERTREVLAEDLSSHPDVTSVFGRFTVHGRRATWTIRGDAQTVLKMEPRRGGPARSCEGAPPVLRTEETCQPDERPADVEGAVDWVQHDAEVRASVSLGVPPDHAADPGLARDRAPAEDLVERIERLAALRERGLLTDDEFTAAKAKILF